MQVAQAQAQVQAAQAQAQAQALSQAHAQAQATNQHVALQQAVANQAARIQAQQAQQAGVGAQQLMYHTGQQQSYQPGQAQAFQVSLEELSYKGTVLQVCDVILCQFALVLSVLFKLGIFYLFHARTVICECLWMAFTRWQIVCSWLEQPSKCLRRCNPGFKTNYCKGLSLEVSNFCMLLAQGLETCQEAQQMMCFGPPCQQCLLQNAIMSLCATSNNKETNL